MGVRRVKGYGVHRSEAIASSRIEGLQASAQQVALAEFSDSEGMPARGFTANARLVANNIAALRRSAVDLAAAPEVTVEGVGHPRSAPGPPGARPPRGMTHGQRGLTPVC